MLISAKFIHNKDREVSIHVIPIANQRFNDSSLKKAMMRQHHQILPTAAFLTPAHLSLIQADTDGKAFHYAIHNKAEKNGIV